MKRNPSFVNNVAGNLSGIQLSLQMLTDLHKPNLYDLFVLHAAARGERVDSPDKADTIFSVEAGTPTRLEEIGSSYMA